MFWTRVKQIEARDAQPLIENGEAVVVDVRRPKDYNESHIEGAILADTQMVHETINLDDKSKRVICYCYMGNTSRTACKNLKKAGYTNVLNLKGGYDAWQKYTG